MRRILLILLCVCPLLARAGNTLSLSSVSGHPGDVVTIEASMSGSEEVVACEWRIPLGQHLTYVPNSIELSASRSDGHSITAASYQDTLIVSIYSVAMKPIKGTEGVLFSFRVTMGNEPATYTLTPEVLLSSEEGAAVATTIQSGETTILSPKISILTPQVDFGHIPIRATYNRTLQVRNVGNEDLHITDVLISAAALTLPQSMWTIAPGQTQNITLTYNPVVRGVISETIRFRSDAVNDADVYQANKVAVVADPFSVNELHVVGASGIADEEVTISLTVNNMEPLVGVQCSFVLPTALEYVENSVAVSTRSAEHVATSTLDGNKLTLMLYSLQNDTLKDHDGEVLTFRLRLNGTSGNYSLNPTEVFLSNVVTENMTSAVYSASVHINSPRLNAPTSINFGNSSVTEKVTAQYAIRNQGNATLTVERIAFLAEGFEVEETLPLQIAQNKTQTITVAYTPTVEGDYSTTMQVYSNDPTNRMHSVALSGHIYEPNEITLSGELTEEGYVLHVSLNNYTDIVGFQMDMECMPNMHPELQKSARLSNHQTLLYALTDSTYKILAYSLTNTAIDAHSGEIFSILFRNTNVPSYNHSNVVLDSIYMSDESNQQRLTSKTHIHSINEQRRITTIAENGTIVVLDSTPASTIQPPVTPVALPDVPFEFDFKATDFDVTTATIANHPDAVLADYQLKLTNNIPTLHDSCLSISSICKGYINKWNFESTASGTYFARSGSNSMTIICKVAPQLGTNNASDFISNRGNGYNYMFRVGDKNSWYLHTGTSYNASRALTFVDNSPQILVCRVNGSENKIVLENMSTGASRQISGVNWGGTNAIFKIFYNDNSEYFRGDFYWVYYSFNYLSDDEVQQVIGYHNNAPAAPADTPSADSCMYDYGSILHLSAIPNAGYGFSQWSDGDMTNPRTITVTEDAMYRAIFNTDSYTITWLNDDGSLIDETTVEYGVVPTHADPVKANTAEYTYTFAGWTPEVIAVTGDATYKATFNATKNSYTITWQNEDGSLIDQTTVEYGVVPTHANPTKEATAEYTYTFAGWTPEVVAVTGDATYKATFNATKNSYTITWQNADESLIDETTVEYGIVPTHANPTKEATAEYTYTFAGWTPEVVAVTGDATYKATFNATKNSYTITWQNEDGSLIDQTIMEYGVVPTHANPVKANTAEYTYTFAGWAPEVVAVTGEATYKATFNATKNSYTITWDAVNGEVEGAGEYAYGTEIELTAIPDAGYVFYQWSDGDMTNPRTITVTEDAEYTALFTSDIGTDVECGNTSAPVIKILRDYQIFILRGEKVYTLQGQEVQ